jgi:hypothetical protein
MKTPRKAVYKITGEYRDGKKWYLVYKKDYVAFMPNWSYIVLGHTLEEAVGRLKQHITDTKMNDNIEIYFYDVDGNETGAK